MLVKCVYNKYGKMVLSYCSFIVKKFYFICLVAKYLFRKIFFLIFCLYFMQILNVSLVFHYLPGVTLPIGLRMNL